MSPFPTPVSQGACAGTNFAFITASFEGSGAPLTAASVSYNLGATLGGCYPMVASALQQGSGEWVVQNLHGSK
jgi:hypothetical protein